VKQANKVSIRLNTKKVSLDPETGLTRKRFLESMPEWADCNSIIISVLKGGITNRLYRVQSEKGDLAVRIYGDKTEMFIDRDNEADAIGKMACLGVSPKLVKYLPAEKITIVDFITGGYTLTNSDFLKEELAEKAIDAVRAIHQSGSVFKRIFNPMNGIEKMNAILAEIGASYPEFDIKGTLSRLRGLSAAIGIKEGQYTPCHNDLLADNFILSPAGDIQLIDWEYAGMAPKYYDIADMFQEILAPEKTEKALIKYYCEDCELAEHTRMINLFKPFPDIFWFLWSMVQNRVSKINFDFYSYGKIKYNNALKNLKGLKEMYGIVKN